MAKIEHKGDLSIRSLTALEEMDEQIACGRLALARVYCAAERLLDRESDLDEAERRAVRVVREQAHRLLLDFIGFRGGDFQDLLSQTVEAREMLAEQFEPTNPTTWSAAGGFVGSPPMGDG